MSIIYPDLENNFPESIDNFDKYLDPTLEMLSVINQYYTLFDTGDLVGATTLLESNPTLKQMIINADNLNQLRDAIISLERYYMDDVQQYLVEIIKFKDIYNPSTKYLKYDVVGYVIGSATEYFMCIDSTVPIGTLPTNATYFIPITLRGEQGASGTGLSYRGGWDGIRQFYKDDCVVYNNILWSANIDNLASEPTLEGSDWTYVMGIQKQIALSNMQPTTQIEGDIWYEII